MVAKVAAAAAAVLELPAVPIAQRKHEVKMLSAAAFAAARAARAACAASTARFSFVPAVERLQGVSMSVVEFPTVSATQASEAQRVNVEAMKKRRRGSHLAIHSLVRFRRRDRFWASLGQFSAADIEACAIATFVITSLNRTKTRKTKRHFIVGWERKK